MKSLLLITLLAVGFTASAQTVVNITVGEVKPVATSCTFSYDSFSHGQGTSIAETISGDTVTWNFSTPTKCGVLGDGKSPWAAPIVAGQPVTVSSVTGADGVQLNIDPTAQGLISGYTENYDSNLAVTFPQSFLGNQVLSAAKFVADPDNCGTEYTQARGCVKSWFHLVIRPLPIDGEFSIRDNTAGTTKRNISFKDFDFSGLKQYSFLATPDTARLTTIAERWSGCTNIMGLETAGETLRGFRCEGLTDDYGAGMAAQFNDDLHYLFSSGVSVTTAKHAWAAMLGFGQDIYYASVVQGLKMGSGAGQWPGSIVPVGMYVALTRDTADNAALQSTLAGYDCDTAADGPHEICQVTDEGFYGDAIAENIRYYLADMWSAKCYAGATGTCNPNTGSKTAKDPWGQIDGPAPQPGAPGAGSYMHISLGSQRGYCSVSTLQPIFKNAVGTANHDRVCSYVDRVAANGVSTANDSCAPPDPNEVVGCSPFSLGATLPTTLAEVQSRTGCEDLTVTWGYNLSDPTQCIPNNSGGNTGQTGRFPALDGNTVTPLFTSSLVEANWTTIRGLDN